MTTRSLILPLTVLLLGGCGGSSDTKKAAIIGWAIGHGGVVHIEGQTLEVKKLTDLPSGSFEIAKIDLTPPEKTASTVTDADLENLKAVPELKSLTLHSTKVTDEGLTHLLALENLKELDLTNTNVSDAGLKVLQDLKSLEKLHVHNTAVTNAGLKEFRSALPSCSLFPPNR
jgi:Leucine-rich repeat (LRR) protein